MRTVPGGVSIHFAHERRGRPSPRQTDSCGGAGGTPSRIAKPRSTGVSRRVCQRPKSNVSLHLRPSSVLSSRSSGDEDCGGGCQRKRATGGGGVAMSMDGYSRIADHVGAEVGRGRSRPWEQKAGTTACASRPAACAASPASASARIHRCTVPVRVYGRLSFPIVPHPHPYSHPGIPSAAALSSTTPRAAACVSEVIPEIPPPSRSPGLEGVSTRAVRSSRAEQSRGETTNDRRAK
ncbi:hypothetical protein B0H14DRAFT_1223088 [Mycena olivaceomarginata]|nr:hypothetical protein B0H14DRAFT_1223088 [Mycena olivaceomarginata]